MKTAKMLTTLILMLCMGLVGEVSGQIPAGWDQADIGEVSIPGEASYNEMAETWTVTGNGYDIWGTSDSFHFVYKPLRGDGRIIARVVSMDETDEWSKAGVMIREELTDESKHAMTVMTPTSYHGPVFQWRSSIGGNSSTSWEGKKPMPYWICVERIGDTFTGFVSQDGTNWERVENAQSQNISMEDEVYIGLVVCARADNSLCTATFDNVIIEEDAGKPDNDWFVSGDDMYAIPTGNVGIGTSIPSEKLHVAGLARFDLGGGRISMSTPGGWPGMIALSPYGNRRDLIFDDSSIRLLIGNSPSPAPADNGITIREDGNVGIGTNFPGSYKLAVNGSAAKVGGGNWSTFSDIKLKDVGAKFKRGLSEVAALNPTWYNYSEDNKLKLPTNKEFIGVIAQDVQGVIPEAVEENDKGYLMVNNDPIIWAMVNAIKELKAENDLLKQKVEALEQKLQ